MKLKKNKKGVTLVEIIVAMTLLGIMSSMFVTAAVYASRANKENYFRAREMYTQANDAEKFNKDKNYEADEIKVNKNIASGKATNEFDLQADFGPIVWDTTAYGYKSKINGIDKNGGYQLKFFEGQDVSVQPNPTKGIYWVKFYNDSGTDLTNYITTPELVGGKFFDVNSNFAGNNIMLYTMTGSSSQIGFRVNSAGTEYFGFSTDGTLYDPAHIAEAADFKLTSTNFDYFCEMDATGLNKTGNIIIHYMGSGVYYNQADYESATP